MFWGDFQLHRGHWLGQGGSWGTAGSGFYVLDISEDAELQNGQTIFSNGTCTIHLMGMYIFEVPRMYRERQKRGKQTMYRVYSDQGQLWQSGVQIWLDMWRWEDYGGRGTALVSRSGMEWDVMGGLVDTTQLTLPQPPLPDSSSIQGENLLLLLD